MSNHHNIGKLLVNWRNVEIDLLHKKLSARKVRVLKKLNPGIMNPELA
jgi:hypothetical protein